MKKPYHIVFTTIFHPLVLNDLFENIAKHGHLERTKIWIVGDRKTPETTPVLAQEINDRGLETTYLSISDQDAWGAEFPEFYKRIPYDNETRRNIGYLHALADGCEVLISIDDDNFPTEDDFIGGHSQTGSVWKGDLLHEPHQFHNVCEHIVFEPSRPIFPRGFPFHLRGTKNVFEMKKPERPVRIGTTAGLWLKEPDVDATTWLNGKIHGVAHTGAPVTVLAQSTWTPVNTQNTSVARELIPAYLCVPMGWDVPGGKLQRYGDIWGGYFLQALMQGTDYHIAFGKPLVEHRRNPHNYVDDLRHEFWGMIKTDWLLNALRTEFKPKETTVLGRIHELAEFVRTEAHPTLPAYTPQEMRTYLVHLGDTLDAWAHVCKKYLS